MTRLAEKTVIVTGGSGGQGAAEARRFVAEGARVVVGDVADDAGLALVAELGDAVRYVHLDVTNADQWTDAVAVASSLGPVTGLVNNAGIMWTRPIDLEDAAGMERMWRVNCLGAFLGIQAVLPSMRAGVGGSIVNVSSTAGLVGWPYLSAYAQSKWALRGLTRTAAIELGRDRIRVNSVHPGPTKTAMLGEVPGVSDHERFGHLPAGRPGTPDDIASLMVYLLSDESTFVTGTELTIDGGQQAGPARRTEWSAP